MTLCFATWQASQNEASASRRIFLTHSIATGGIVNLFGLISSPGNSRHFSTWHPINSALTLLALCPWCGPNARSDFSSLLDTPTPTTDAVWGGSVGPWGPIRGQKALRMTRRLKPLYAIFALPRGSMLPAVQPLAAIQERAHERWWAFFACDTVLISNMPTRLLPRSSARASSERYMHITLKCQVGCNGPALLLV